MPITTLPALDRTSATFKADVDTFFGAQLPAFAIEANALETNVNAKEATASVAASTATTKAAEASGSATVASTAANAAAASAATAVNSPGTSATSVTSMAIGLGAKTLTIQTGKLFAIGQFVTITRTSDTTNYLFGKITAHNSGTGELTINAEQIGGSGTYTDWTIALSSAPLVISPLLTATLTLPSSAAAGMSISFSMTGTPLLAATTITSFEITSWTGAVTTVSASGNAASSSLVAPETIGSILTVSIVAIDSHGNRSAAVVHATTIVAVSVNTPSITAPTNGATAIGATPALTTGAFGITGDTDTHYSTDWEIWTGAGRTGTLIWSSINDAANKTTIAVPAATLSVSTTYYIAVRHKGTTYGYGGYAASSFTTAASFEPTTIGEAYGGGFYAGKIVIGANTYYLIVSPKSSGHHTSKQWKTTNDTTTGTLSLNDGLTNSNAMNNASHPAAQFCRGLTIGGYSDWYLPSRDELEICYRNLKPGTTTNTVYASRITNFGAGGNGVDSQGNGDNDNSNPLGDAYTTSVPTVTSAASFTAGSAEAYELQYYWASTEFTATTAWKQSFSHGGQDNGTKGTTHYVRAVRKVLI
ncbi:MAG: DUF1566 domain-containing protein [Methylobacter sp.]|nr:DUF1566 domain-containing protein [Methylobacter sp.]MDP2099841.1 DUF1566 domain-containing protein [Methylobacter sp.]MDP2427961.1 DUF1566 domain-containing protein [Methylobacter sp.]MDP3054221.1 DUF1566 domain-containing protein [Methylobacter sp.]MDP3361136.1 DUF1566 domain-containing protein [Methylobacter sp.]